MLETVMQNIGSIQIPITRAGSTLDKEVQNEIWVDSSALGQTTHQESVKAD
jgi:hypothetical protein